MSKKTSLFELVGLLSNEEAEELRNNIKKLRKRMRDEMNKTARELQD